MRDQLAVQHDVQRAAAGEAEPARLPEALAEQVLDHRERDALEQALRRGGDVDVRLGEHVARARRPEAIHHRLAEAPSVIALRAGRIDELAIHPQRLAVPGDQIREVDLVGVAVRRHAHHLVLAVVGREAQEVGDGRVEDAERRRALDLVELRDLSAAQAPEQTGGHLRRAVDRDQLAVVEAREEIGARRVREVVLDLAHVRARGVDSELPQRLVQLAQLAPAPAQALAQEASDRERGLLAEIALDVGQEVVSDRAQRPGVRDRRHVLGADSGLLQAEARALDGACVARVLAPAEALLLGGGDEHAVDHDRRARVVPRRAVES